MTNILDCTLGIHDYTKDVNNHSKNPENVSKSCVTIRMEIKPAMLPFFTASDVNNEQKTLKPYMAPVNHNHLHETMMLKIVHTYFS